MMVVIIIIKFSYNHALITKVKFKIKELLLKIMLIKNLIILILYYKISS